MKNNTNDYKIAKIDNEIRRIRENIQSEESIIDSSVSELNELSFFGPFIVAPALGVGLFAIAVPIILFNDPNYAQFFTSFKGVLGGICSELFGSAMFFPSFHLAFIYPRKLEKRIFKSENNIKEYEEKINEKNKEKKDVLELINNKDYSDNKIVKNEEEIINDIVYDNSVCLTNSEVKTKKRSLKPNIKR